MTITRANFEEFCILYGDNELSTDDRRRLEEFVEANPDLRMEFDLWSRVKLTPDNSIRFDLKEMLIESEAELNEDLLLYLDNEMPAELRPEFEEALDLDPEMLNELILFSKTKLDPKEELIEFPHKQSLYRTGERRRVIPIFWQRIAAVAAVLAAITITTVSIYNNREQQHGEGVAQAQNNSSNNTIVTPSLDSTGHVAPKTQGPKQDAQPKEMMADNAVKEQANGTAKEEAGLAVTGKQSATGRQPFTKESSVSPKQQRIIDQVKETPKDNIAHTDNKLPKATNNPYLNTGLNPGVQQPSKNDNVIASNSKDELNANKNKNQQLPVTQQNDGALQTVATVSPVNMQQAPSFNDDNVDADQSRKNKHRGFFRKVTRTFEKNTNIKASDDDRLLVGGLAIRL